ncbi:MULTISPECIES: hypothetical protein [unclassified Haloferax]|uniref:DUF7342 family protein n=1 Tax=unclassified Haloferax TaxID=2625095 RepID=UPI002875F3FE|nr:MULTISPECIES: hypothetical protein [unclassified Haloferax]MDS0243755.1 hypothetical protein [Haloferax sp. S2CR25]MDS0446876.1 hypothetical protein [Haloferax sp. S2CR25-2]
MTDDGPPTFDASEQWRTDRTTFQRVYDILVGTDNPASAQQLAEWADCSENGARQALQQLTEMGIAEKTDTRPATYKRNTSYLRWKRVEQLARGHSPSDLRARVEELIEEDQSFQAEYGVPEPDAVVTTENVVDDHEVLHQQWEDLSEWRTIRRDIQVIQQAVHRAESMRDDRARV